MGPQRPGLRAAPQQARGRASPPQPSGSLQPVPNHNPWMLLYFISFLLIVSFFVLNMFVGVVVENFHKCRQHQEAEEARRREEKRLRRLEKKRRSAWVTPRAGATQPGPPLPSVTDPGRRGRGLGPTPASGHPCPWPAPSPSVGLAGLPEPCTGRLEPDGATNASQVSQPRQRAKAEPGCPTLSCGTPVLSPADQEPLLWALWGR